MPASLLLAALEMEGYISPWKLLPFLVVLVIWAKLLTWADKDAVAAHMAREQINTGLFLGLIVGTAFFFLLPNFILSFAAFIIFLGIDIGVYLALRHAKVGLKDLKQEMKQTFLSFGSKKGKSVKEVVDQVQFINASGALLPSPKAEDPTRPVFDALQETLTDPLRRNAEMIEVISSQEGVGVRYAVDGVGYRAKTLDRNVATSLIALAKKYASMDVADRRKPQTGKVKVSVNGKRHELTVNTAGSSAGESMRILVDAKKRHNFQLNDLGLNAQQMESVRASIADGTGIVLVAAPKGQGLTSMLYALIRGHDAFVEHIQTIEREPELDLEGITQNPLPATPPPGEETRLAEWVSSQQPDAILISHIEEQKAAVSLINFAKEKRVYVGLRANGIAEAIAAWRKLVGDNRQAMSQLRMVVTGRVIRKLCTACKIAYTPDPATLRKMNMDPSAVTQLFQARTQPMRNDKGHVIPCTFCLDMHYNGRIGVFEILNVDDDVRAALLADSANQLKAAFRKQKGKYLQEAALEVVERGDTSVQEVLRVLRGPEAKAAPAKEAAHQS